MAAADGKSGRPAAVVAGEGKGVTGEGAIRVGVVGLGSFGSHHARHYASLAGARLVAVADADFSRACAAAAKYGAAAYRDHRGLIGVVDAASVTVPAALHHEVARDLIDAGIHVLVEKPLAADRAAAADLVAHAERTGVVLLVGHIERFSPAFRALAERVRAPRLMSFVRHAVWQGRAADVDVVRDLMIHDIDLALTLAGAPVVSVAASGASVVTTSHDVAEARIEFASGAVATLAASRVAARAVRTAEVIMPGCRFTADFAAPSLSMTGHAESGPVESRTIPLVSADNLAAEIAAFLGSIETGASAFVDGRAGLDAVRVADMILSAIARRAAGSPLNGDATS
jgi:predicted dehydrogenase